MEYHPKMEKFPALRIQKIHRVVRSPNLPVLYPPSMMRLAKSRRCLPDHLLLHIASKSAGHSHHSGRNLVEDRGIVSVSCLNQMVVFLLGLILPPFVRYDLNAIHVDGVKWHGSVCVYSRDRISCAGLRYLGRGMLH